jgi:hypothetical protein
MTFTDDDTDSLVDAIDTDYDPTSRVWITFALAADGTQVGDPLVALSLAGAARDVRKLKAVYPTAVLCVDSDRAMASAR